MSTVIFRRPGAGDHPPNRFDGYRSTPLRAPSQPAVALPHSLSEITGPLLQGERLDAGENDLTRQRMGEPLGERIVVHGRVLDEDGKAVPGALVEIWQCNAAGRYIHVVDQHPAPIDPNFTGAGRVVTDADGNYQFVSIKPGAYPWGNHPNAWRPAHIHFSLFGPSFLTRLVTQMYFPGDPLFPYDPIFNSAPAKSRCWSSRAIRSPELRETLPVVGCSAPVIRLKRVVFPLPFRPTTPHFSPGSTVNVTSLRRSVAP